MEEDKHLSKTAILINRYDNVQPPTENDIPIDSTDYSRLIGKLTHLMVYIRPDITFSLGKLS